MDREVIDAALGSVKRLWRFDEGESIFHEDDEPQGIYLVKEGTVELTCAARSGRAKHASSVGRGEMLGLSAIATQRNHLYSATARTLCEIEFIDRNEVLRALEETPAVWFTVLHSLSRQVNAAYEEMRNLARRQSERTSA